MATAAPSATPDTTITLVRRAADEWPDVEALVDGDVRLTFAQLREEVERATCAAMAAGLRKGDRAAIWAPNVWQWVVSALGLHSAGAVVVPLNTRYRGDEAAYILRRSRARILFTVRGFLGVDYPAMLADHDTPVEQIVVFDDPTWGDFVAGRSDREPPTVGPDDLSDLIFTSGTTGRPKGVMSTHGQTVAVYRQWCEIVGLQPGDRYLVVSPFFHTFGYKAGFIGALTAGATTIPAAVADIPSVLDLVSRERITMLPATPTLFQGIFDHPGLTDHDLSSLRLTAVGATTVPVELVRRMKAELCPTVITGYGLTESTGVTTMSWPDDPPERIAATVGRPLPGVEVRVVGEHGADVSPGSPGEVLVRGYNVMAGYFDDPQQTAAAIDPDGWLHTGDVGVLDADGYLTITDRLKDMFIVGGFNAYPAEIEAMLLDHPDVARAAVIGIPHERLGEVGMAFVVPRPGSSPTAEAIIDWSRERMANYKVPRRVAFVDELPMNATGKVLKHELRAMAAASSS